MDRLWRPNKLKRKHFSPHVTLLVMVSNRSGTVSGKLPEVNFKKT